MRLLIVGTNHSSASLPTLERLSIPSGDLDAALAQLKSAVREGLIVSTCNRTEVYATVGHAPSGAEALQRFLADRSGLDVADVRAACYVYVHDAAVRHLLRVTSGLDSMVLGEDQIQAQVKRAILVARNAGALGPTLERLGAAALACGKRVRTFTGIGRHAVSLESLAVRAATDRLAPLATKRALVIGAGDSAALIVRHLGAAGAERITIANRSAARAASLARGANVATTRWSELPRAIAAADVLFCCTSAPRPVVTAKALESRFRVRPGDALLCVDLGMPRGVEPAAARIPGVSIVTLDELATMAATHRDARREHVPAAEAIVDAEAARFLEWLYARGVLSSIARLQAHAEAIADAELARTLSRLESATSRDRALVAEMARRIARKLMHRPIGALKHEPEAENMALILEYLFGAGVASDALEARLPTLRGGESARDIGESVS